MADNVWNFVSWIIRPERREYTNCFDFWTDSIRNIVLLMHKLAVLVLYNVTWCWIGQMVLKTFNNLHWCWMCWVFDDWWLSFAVLLLIFKRHTSIRELSHILSNYHVCPLTLASVQPYLTNVVYLFATEIMPWLVTLCSLVITSPPAVRQRANALSLSHPPSGKGATTGGGGGPDPPPPQKKLDGPPSFYVPFWWGVWLSLCNRLQWTKLVISSVFCSVQ